VKRRAGAHQEVQNASVHHCDPILRFIVARICLRSAVESKTNEISTIQLARGRNERILLARQTPSAKRLEGIDRRIEFNRCVRRGGAALAIPTERTWGLPRSASDPTDAPPEASSDPGRPGCNQAEGASCRPPHGDRGHPKTPHFGAVDLVELIPCLQPLTVVAIALETRGHELLLEIPTALGRLPELSGQRRAVAGCYTSWFSHGLLCLPVVKWRP